MIRGFPEVESVVSQHGRPDDGTDAAGFFNAEFFAPLKPADAVAPGLDKDDLTAEILAKLQAEFPGVEFNFSQYLQDNVAEAVSGVKGENSIKLFGNDLQSLTDTANKIKAVLATVQGITDLAVFTSLGQPTVQIDIDRARAARYGLTPGDINATIRVAIGGDSAGDLYEPGSDRHFPIVVRLAPQYRQSPEAIQNLRIGVQGPNGVTQIPLSEVATVKLVSGAVLHLSRAAAALSADQVQRARPRPRQRHPGGAAEGRRAGAAAARLAARMGRRVRQSAGRDRAAARSWCRSASALIALLLWINFGSAIDTLLAMSVIPMAVIGGIFGLFVMQIPFSVSAAIGFIALFGISVMDGIIIMSQYNQLIARRRRPHDRGAAHRRAADAPGADDLHHRRRRPAAGRAVERHRLAGAEAARRRGRGRHDAGADRHPDHAAGADLAVLALLPPVGAPRTDARANLVTAYVIAAK